MIESPIKQFLDGDLKGNLKEHCRVVLKNTRRLLDLVNQLLDLSKLESGRVKLKACRQNLIPLVSGLVLAKEYVELHSGSIIVTSKPGVLTSFNINLPLGRKHLSDNEIIIEDDGRMKKVHPLKSVEKYSEYDLAHEKPIGNQHARILIIEDNLDVRNYLSGLLQPDYLILQAENGKEGLQKARNQEPDLIISDVMMPEMDGYEMCRVIKEDIEISHIPVILLTARASQEEKHIGLDAGADDYILKPFEAKELHLRVHNILTAKKRIYEKFKRSFEIDAGEVAVTSADKMFFSRLTELVNTDSSNANLKVEEIADQMSMSLTTLTRKIKALVNLTPSEFLRNMRMKRAKKLLLSGFGNISEVAFEVGFNSLSYFAKCYKQQFGITPSQELIIQQK